MSQDTVRLDVFSSGPDRLMEGYAAAPSESGEALRNTLLHTSAPAMLFDDAGSVLLFSRAWLELVGDTAEELPTIEDWIEHADGEGARTVLRYLRDTAQAESMRARVDLSFEKNAQRRHWSFVASALDPLPDGRRVFLCIINDMTRHKEVETAARESEQWFRSVVEALPGAVYTTDAAGRITLYNQAAAALWGCWPKLGEDQWCGSWRLYRPDGTPLAHDQCPTAVALKENRPIRGAEAVAERPDGTRVPFLAYPTPLRDASGALVGAVNMLVDITERKRTERRLTLLTQEVNYRARNMLAVMQAILRLTRAETVREFATAIQGRIDALARAHSLLSDSHWHGADLSCLVADELAPYRRRNASCVHVDGPAVTLAPAVAQAIAMMIHELATNAVKHGALTASGGHVSLRWGHNAEGELILRWAETGGPPVRPPSRQGFGIGIIERTVRDQLDGAVRLDWRPEGLVCEIAIPAHLT